MMQPHSSLASQVSKAYFLAILEAYGASQVRDSTLAAFINLGPHSGCFLTNFDQPSPLRVIVVECQSRRPRTLWYLQIHARSARSYEAVYHSYTPINA